MTAVRPLSSSAVRRARAARPWHASTDVTPDLAVHARVDRAVRLAGPAGDRGDQRVALGAQPLAALERGLRLGGRGGRRRERRRRRRRRRLGEQLQRVAGLRRLQHVVVAAGARPQRAEALARPRPARRARRPRSPAELEIERVVALLLDLRRELLQRAGPTAGRRGSSDPSAPGVRRMKRPIDLAEEQLGARASSRRRRRAGAGRRRPRRPSAPTRARLPRAGREARDPRGGVRRVGGDDRRAARRRSAPAGRRACSRAPCRSRRRAPPASGCVPARSARQLVVRVAQHVARSSRRPGRARCAAGAPPRRRAGRRRSRRGGTAPSLTHSMSPP